MTKYINADELVEHLNSTIAMLEKEMQGYAFADGMRRAYEVVRDEVKKMPTADVRKVVLCKDCKYIIEHYDTDGNAPYWTCSEWDSGTDYDGFCHYAEKKKKW